MEAHISRFNRAASRYGEAAELQARVAARLAETIYTPLLAEGQSVLEIGCGTGFLTRHLPRVFGDAATFIITDAAPEMVLHCKSAFAHATLDLRFNKMDGQNIPLPPCSLDHIVTSMTVQWFDDPVKSLQDLRTLLKPDGMLSYATIGADNFTEWREHLEHLGLDSGMRPQPENLPGILYEEFVPRDYKDGFGFIDMLKNTGAGTPKPDYVKPPPRAFRKAVESFDGEVTWHIVYGRLPALTR